MDKLTEKIQKVYEEKFLNEKVSGYRLITSRVERMLKNKPKKDQEKILTRYYNELAKSDEWKKLNDTEKKSVVKYFNKMQDALEKGKDPLGESITKYHKIQQVYESMLTEAKKVNLPKEVTKIVKKYGFDYDTSLADGQVDFFYVPGKRIPEGGEWAKIQIPYFMELIEDGEQVTAWVAQYSGEELVDDSRQIIYNLKGLDTIMRGVKSNVDSAVTRNKRR